MNERPRDTTRRVAGVLDSLSSLVEGSTRSRMGSAPKECILQQWKLRVEYVLPRDEASLALADDLLEDPSSTFPIPVLLVPPLMVRPYVYDLRPDHSYVRMLRDRGFRVYFVDFGVPDEDDETLRLDHYVYTFLPAAISAVLQHSGAPRVTLIGYCMGGIFSLLYTAAFHPSVQPGPLSDRVNAIVTIGAPINFAKLGVLSLAARFGQGYVDRVMDVLGNVPSIAAELGFKVMGGTRTVTKWFDLARRLHDDQYVRGFDAINTWVNDLLPYPREAFKQMVKEVVGQNRILKRQLVLAGRTIDLSRIDVPLLAFAGATDNIATPPSTREVLSVVGSTDKTFIEVPGGHVGVVNGPAAPELVWKRSADWLATRSLSGGARSVGIS